MMSSSVCAMSTRHVLNDKNDYKRRVRVRKNSEQFEGIIFMCLNKPKLRRIEKVEAETFVQQVEA
jgi:hypothetical protein